MRVFSLSSSIKKALEFFKPLLFSAVLIAPIFVSSCEEEKPRDTFDISLLLVDEAGEPIEGARLETRHHAVITNSKGRARLMNLSVPEMIIAHAEGYLDEPVPVGWEDSQSEVRVVMLSDGDGNRIVLHFGGDVMFGRRYNEPTEGEPLLPPGREGPGARKVVEFLKRPFSCADFCSVNLETVVSEKSYSSAYPGKRFLLRSHPESLQGLEALGVDLVVLANNHARDWGDEGIKDTIEALQDKGFPFVGAVLTEEEAELGKIVQVGAYKVGTVSYTTVTGSFVNDNYPPSEEEIPTNVEDEERWLYEERLWGYEGDEWSVGVEERRIGDVWIMYNAVESTLSREARAEIWASIDEVYPEMQDWVARRGHGGAAQWSSSDSAKAIEALASKVDIMIAQLHCGFQFQPSPSNTIRKAARAAIDAGAHIVIAHHPHVLQGMEWYKGRLIVYSLGNFIFDQDFLATFDSGFLRAVFDGPDLVQARFVPLSLIGYKPTPVVGEAARRILRRVWESSVFPGQSARDPKSRAVRIFEHVLEGDAAPAQMVFEHNTARIVTASNRQKFEVELKANKISRLPSDMLFPGGFGADSDFGDAVMVGRDLFGWGRFEDESIDNSLGGSHWSLAQHEDKQVLLDEAPSGRGVLKLSRDTKNESRVFVRPVARVPITSHRLWRDAEGEAVPLDPAAGYSVVFRGRLKGSARAELRLDIYHFDDTNPTEDPESTRLAREELTIDGLDDHWSLIEIPFEPNRYHFSLDANMVMFYFLLSPPDSDKAHLEIDDFALVEWRPASQMPDVFSAFDYARSDRDAILEMQALSAHPSL